MNKLLLATSAILLSFSMTQPSWSMTEDEQEHTLSTKRKISEGKVQTSFGDLFYRDSGGPGPVVVCVHSNSTDSRLFENLMRTNSNLRFIAFDSPGHGKSFGSKIKTNPDFSDDLARQVYSFQGVAKVILEGLDKLGIDKCFGLGISRGGDEVINAMALDPNRFMGSVISGAPILPHFTDKEHLQSVISKAYKESSASGLSGQERQFTQDEARAYLQASGIDPDENKEMVQTAENTDGRARSFMFESAIANRGVDEVETLKKLEKPVLILGGDDDEFINYNYTQGLGLPKHVKIIVLPGEEHLFVFTKPQLFNSYLESFVLENQGLNSNL